MTGLTRECGMCKGSGFVRYSGALGRRGPRLCAKCKGEGTVPVLERELEAHGQERLPLEVE